MIEQGREIKRPGGMHKNNYAGSGFAPLKPLKNYDSPPEPLVPKPKLKAVKFTGVGDETCWATGFRGLDCIP